MPRLVSYLRQHFAEGIVFVVAVLWACVVLFGGDRPKYRHAPGAEEGLIARHIARGEGFASPMDESARAEATSWSPPVYPYVMAMGFRWLGIDTLRTAILLAWVNAISFGVVGVCAWKIGRMAMRNADQPAEFCARGERAAGIGALVMVAAHPITMRFVYDYWDGELALAMFMVCVALAATWGQKQFTSVRAAILGGLLGVLSLTNAAYVIAYPAIVLLAARKLALRGKARCAVLATLTFIVVLIPWTVRNYQEFGRIIYVRGGAQLELWIGNRPNSSGWLSPTTPTQHPYRNAEERALLLEMGEMRYFDLCGQRFRENLRADPWNFVRLTVKRIKWLFFGDPGTRGWIEFPMRWGIGEFDIEHLALLGTTLLGAASVVLGGKRFTMARWLLLIAGLSVAPFFITSSVDRYALPLRTMLCVLSVVTIVNLCIIRRRRTDSRLGFAV